ncbi:MAG: fumarylacetoacetate hydrolase family protein [Bryobacteraceae bacterium]
MRLGQLKWNGVTTAAIFDHVSARPIPDYTLADLIARAEKEGESLPELANGLASRHPVGARPIIPLYPKEVWAAGSTYQDTAEKRDVALAAGKSFHMNAHKASRPEIVFKGTSRICVGPDQSIGIRPDSAFTAPAAEIALVLGANGHILGYMLANDVTAQDLESENPLYTAQAKTFSGSCALGPYLVTADEINDPHLLEITCQIERGGHEIFRGKASTANLGRKLDSLVEYLMRGNPVPPGSLLLTGTGIMVDRGAALAHGDSVTIQAPQLGELRNTAARLQ